MLNWTPAGNLTEHYEELRAHFIERTHANRNLGLIYLLRHGVAAWARAWTDCMPTQEFEPRQCTGDAQDLPSGIDSEVVLILAGMALKCRREAVIA